ncbi:hypothetical protein M514_20856, partial [Trichuris suis]
QVYGSSASSKSVVYEWIRRFKEGTEAIEDDRRAGRPATATSEGTVPLVRSLVKETAELPSGGLLEWLGSPSIRHLEYCMKPLLARWVPKALREEQLVRRVNLSQELLTKIKANETWFLDRIVTGDETWIYQYDPESKMQSKQWLPRGSAGRVKFNAERSARKVMATIFWDSDGRAGNCECEKVNSRDYFPYLHHDNAPAHSSRTVRTVLALARKRRGKLHLGVLFHHDNVPGHSSRTVRTVLREFRWELIPHQPYCPDLAPSDFFLFPKLKEHLKGTLFEPMDNAKRAVSTWCNTQPPGL